MMGVNLSKTSHIIFFLVGGGLLAIIASWLFSIVIEWISPDSNIPFWVEGLSPLGAYGLLFWLFDRYLWKAPIFEKLGIVNVPNLNGRWIGKQRSTYKDADGNNVSADGVLEIRQTFTSISVNTYYQKSYSSSKVGNFARNNPICYLYYTFDNEPNSMIEETMQMHKGTVKLNYLSDSNQIKGTYFNSIGNIGDMTYSYQQKELLDCFSD
jgi:hypothetical protein